MSWSPALAITASLHSCAAATLQRCWAAGGGCGLVLGLGLPRLLARCSRCSPAFPTVGCVLSQLAETCAMYDAETQSMVGRLALDAVLHGNPMCLNGSRRRGTARGQSRPVQRMLGCDRLVGG